MTSPDVFPAQPSLSALAADIRASGILGRAHLMNRLFDCLVERSVAGEAVKEIELARTVFDLGPKAEPMQDGSVRVYVYRLRRKLDGYYQTRPDGPRLVLPKGEYRLTVAYAASARADVEPESRAGLPLRHKFWLACAMVTVGAMGLALGLWLARPAPPAASSTGFWAFLGANGRPTFIVIGDYYAFGVKGGARRVLDPAIRSDIDLEQFNASHPQEAASYTTQDAHYLPPSAAFAIRSLMPVVDKSVGATGNKAGVARITLLSDLTPDVMKGANIIYVGAIDGLGKLEDVVFARSRFHLDRARALLVDRQGRAQLELAPAATGGKDRMTRQYAYIATFEGPSHSRFIIVAGSGNAATKQAAEIVTDAAQIEKMQNAAKGTANFEALWQVNTLNNVAYSATLLFSSRFSPQDGELPNL